MFLLIHFYILLLLSILALPTLRAHALVVRDTTSDVATTKGGVLVKNGKQTSCELGVIDSTAAFVAAPCLDFSGSSVNMTTTYEVYLDTGIDNNAAKYTVSSITVHPEYNATINLNPIAVLQFNKGSTETWSNPIAINRNDSWGDILFIRRGLTDMNSMEWETPLTVTNGYSDAAACSADTRIFEFNQNDLFCSNATTYPPYAYLTGCAIPYGSVDAYISGKIFVAGIYAYTAVSVSSYQCTLRDLQDSFYLLFADYVAFANKVLGRSISYYPNSNGISPQSDSGYTMQTPDYLYTFRLVSDGDFYANQTDSSQDDSSSSVSDSEDQSQGASDSDVNSRGGAVNSDTLSDPSKDPDNGSGDSESASSKKATIIGVVCGILGGILLTCLALFFYRRWKKTHKNIYKDKDTQMDMQSMLVVDADNRISPVTIRMRPELTPKPTVQPPENIFERDHFEILDYDLPPLYEPNASTTTANQLQQQHNPYSL